MSLILINFISVYFLNYNGSWCSVNYGQIFDQITI